MFLGICDEQIVTTYLIDTHWKTSSITIDGEMSFW